MACRQRGCSTVHRKVFFCKMDTRDKAIKPSKYDFSTVFRLKENRQNLIHGMCHVLVVLHELTLLYTMQKRRDPKIFPFHCTQWSDCCWHFPSLKKKLRKELIIWWEILVLFFSAKRQIVALSAKTHDNGNTFTACGWMDCGPVQKGNEHNRAWPDWRVSPGRPPSLRCAPLQRGPRLAARSNTIRPSSMAPN